MCVRGTSKFFKPVKSLLSNNYIKKLYYIYVRIFMLVMLTYNLQVNKGFYTPS